MSSFITPFGPPWTPWCTPCVYGVWSQQKMLHLTTPIKTYMLIWRAIWRAGLQFKIKKENVFKKILVSFTIIWIQLCHYSRLLSASKGLLNTLMIRLQNELIFSVLLPPWLPPCSLEEPHKELVNISNEVPPVEASGTSQDLWPHFVTGSTRVTQHRHTQTLTVTQGSCSHNIFKSVRRPCNCAVLDVQEQLQDLLPATLMKGLVCVKSPSLKISLHQEHLIKTEHCLSSSAA